MLRSLAAAGFAVSFLLLAGNSSAQAPTTGATALSNTQISVSVNDVNEGGAVGVYRWTTGTSPVLIHWNSPGNHVITSSGLSPNTTYYYCSAHGYVDEVGTFFNVFGCGNTASATTFGPPAAPASLGATLVSGTQANLSWADQSGNETSFRIERKTGSGGTFSEIHSVGTNVTSYSNTGLAADTTYYYRVRARNAYGDSAYTSSVSALTVPGAPSGLSATAVSPSQINLS